MRLARKGRRAAIGAAAGAAALMAAALVAWQAGSWEGAHRGGPEGWSAETRQHVETRREAAMAMIDVGELGQARVLLEELKANYPQDPATQTLLARAYFGLGQDDRAYQAARRAVELDPAEAEAADLAGMLAEKRGETEAARRMYAAAAAARPDRPKYRVQLANALLKLDDLAGARREAEAALALDPTLAVAHGVLGYAARRDGEPRRAAAHFRDAVRHSDGRARRLAWTLQLARTLRERGPAGAGEAVNVLTGVSEDLREGERQVTVELARAYAAMGRHADAAGAWRAWSNTHPGDAAAAAKAGLAYLEAAKQTNDPQMARAYRSAAEQFHQRAERFNTHHPDVRKLGMALGEMSDMQ